HRHRAGERNDHRHRVHAVRRAVHLHAARADARGGGPGASPGTGDRAGSSRLKKRFVMTVRNVYRRAVASIAFGSLMIATTASAQLLTPARPVPSNQPGPIVSLTVDEAVRRAVENNPDLAIVRLSTEVEAARVGETRGAYAPVFSTTL